MGANIQVKEILFSLLLLLWTGTIGTTVEVLRFKSQWHCQTDAQAEAYKAAFGEDGLVVHRGNQNSDVGVAGSDAFD